MGTERCRGQCKGVRQLTEGIGSKGIRRGALTACLPDYYDTSSLVRGCPCSTCAPVMLFRTNGESSGSLERVEIARKLRLSGERRSGKRRDGEGPGGRIFWSDNFFSQVTHGERIASKSRSGRTRFCFLSMIVQDYRSRDSRRRVGDVKNDIPIGLPFP